jgi:hypothetical protein
MKYVIEGMLAHLQGFLVILREACTVYPVFVLLVYIFHQVLGTNTGLPGVSTRSMYSLTCKCSGSSGHHSIIMGSCQSTLSRIAFDAMLVYA